MSGLKMDNVSPQKLKVDNNVRIAMAAMAGLGAAVLVLGFIFDRERAWHAYLVSFFYFTCLAMGGLFFTAIQHVAAAGWSVNVRRFAGTYGFHSLRLLLGLPIVLFAGKDLYLWLNAEEVAKDPILLGKAAYLNKIFFIVRFVSSRPRGFSSRKRSSGSRWNRTKTETRRGPWTRASGPWPFLSCSP